MADFTIKWQGDQATAAMRAGAARGLFLAAEHVLGESRMVVPIEESILSQSGATDVDAGSLEASVSYDTPYAVKQHEDLTLRHDAGRTAKYLENPLNSTRDAQMRIIADQIKGKLA